MKTAAITIRFPQELKDQLKAECDKRSINMSDWFRKRAEEFIKQKQRQPAFPTTRNGLSQERQ